MTELTSEERAYMAGFFDGEGTCFVSRRPHRQIAGRLSFQTGASVANNNYAVLLWHRDVFGGYLHGPLKKRNPLEKDAYRWTVSHQKCRTYLEAVLPWVRIKRPQAENCLRLISLMAARPRGKRRLDEDEYAAQQACYETHINFGLSKGHTVRWREESRVQLVPIERWTAGEQEVLVGV